MRGEGGGEDGAETPLNEAEPPADGADAAAASEGSGDAECACFKCDDSPCHPPECSSCGTKEASGCKMVSGVAYPPWGCYTYGSASCKCEAARKDDDDHYGGYHGGDDDYYERYHRGMDNEFDDYPSRYPRYNDDDDYDFKHDDYQEDDYKDNDFADAHDEKTTTDYNQEYYHGEAKSDDQDEGQAQTGEQFMLGPHILVQPVTAIDASSTSVYLPAAAQHEPGVWYDLHTAERHETAPDTRVVSVPIHPDRVPAFLRGGAILPRRDRPRRSSRSTHTDPFTLVVAPDAAGGAAGELFLDEYDGFAADVSMTAHFSFDYGVLKNRVGGLGDAARPPPASTSPVERIHFLGQTAARKVIVRRASGEIVAGVEALFDGETATLTVRQPKVKIGEAWSVELQ